jgi:cytochrome c oxidase subunit 2
MKLIVKKYEFVPAEIHVKAGDTVQFEVTTADVQHGFSIPDLKIDESIQPGRPAVFNHVFDKPGTYKIECSIICGPHHDDMIGKLIVE